MPIFIPSHCFCHYDIRDLLALASQKFLQGKKTVDLMREAQSDEERSQVAILSLLDLDDEQVLAILDDKTTGPNCHILSCREMLKNQLKGMLQLKPG